MEKQKNEKLNENMEDISSSSSSSSESSGEEEHITIDDGKIDRLEAKLMAFPYEYSNHIEYISALRKVGLIEKLKEARENMNKYFPLPPEQWLQWIEDEISLISTKESKDYVMNLYQRAIEEYHSVAIWISYIEFMEREYEWEIENNNQNINSLVEKVRNVYENAITHVGLNIPEGIKIWNKIINFEKKYLDFLENQKKEENSIIKKQKDKVISIYKRLLSIPLEGLDEKMNEFSEWLMKKGEQLPSEISNLYNQAVKQYQERKSFEDQISSTYNIDINSSNYSSGLQYWISYIDFEINQKSSPNRVICLFERAIPIYFLSPDLWKKYIYYLFETFPAVSKMAVDICKRAIRNYSWDGKLWSLYIIAMEKADKNQKEIQEIFENGINSGLTGGSYDYYELFQSYIDYQRRNILKNKSSINESDGNYLRETLQKAVEYFLQYFPSDSTVIYIQRYWADIECELFKNLTNSRSIWESLIKANGWNIEYWMNYINMERYFGDKNNCRALFKRACNCIHDGIEKICYEWLLFERELGTLEQFESAYKICNKYLEKEAQQREKETQKLQIEQQKEKEKKEKLSKFQNKKKGKKRERISDENEKKQKKRKIHEQKETINKETTQEPKTIFVVNLPFSTSEDDLKELFSKYGIIKEIRLVKDKDGRSKGFGYIEYEKEEFAQAALVVDKTDFKGRTLKVSISTPPVKSKRDYPDNNTIYVSNLPSDINENLLREFFSTCGEIKDIRIVKERETGKSKGFAYIDFINKESLQKAIELDQKNILNQPVNVARSRPPSKSIKSFSSRNLDNNIKQNTIISKPKNTPKTILLPRSLRPKTNIESEKTMKSNEDFKNELLKKS